VTAPVTAELEQLVVQALEVPYSSFSATDDSETGNRYQAVGLGHRTTRGLREDRGRFLDVLDLRGRTVLDLGSNLGQISREARARGAALVDGFEIDPYFNEVAQLVNVLTGTTGVSFYERDMADPDTYTDRYDVVLAFSAFRFIAGCLDRLARATDVMVVETHELKGNFDERYLEPLTQHFPVFRVLGESDVERLRAGGVRAVGLFARDEAALRGALAPELRDAGAAAGVFAAGVRGRRIRGAVESLELDGGRLRTEGWCRDLGTAHDTVELSTSAEGPAGVPFGTLAVTEPAGDGRFCFECEAPVAAQDVVRLDVSAYAGDAALGTISAYWSADLGPGELTQLTIAHELLEPVGRYRVLEAFESALDCSPDSPLPQRFLERLVPNARWSRKDGPGGLDLVVGHAVAVEEPGMRELQRITRPGAYLALSVLGELARDAGEPGIPRDDLLAACVPLFDVVSYVAGGVAGRHDLVVLRRRTNGASP
jgi:SAM-dependent methyltransferase